ncbi:MAG TPA: hypothetical protein VF607_12850, partial [Verrucomicrobiae bacterium]
MLKNALGRYLSRLACLTLGVLPLLSSAPARGQGTAFSYQGRLSNNGGSANGSYDFRFALYDLATAGTQQGVLITNNATVVSNGLFAVTLDFGNQFPGAARWLELSVRSNGSGAFTTLGSRQPLTPTPYAIQAAGAASLSGFLPATQVSGTLTPAQLPANIVTNGASAVTLAGSFGGTFAGNFGAVSNLSLSPLTNGLPANRLRFTDTPGAEDILLHAHRNMDFETENTATFWAGLDYLTTVDRDNSLHAKRDNSLTVDRN